MGYKTMPSDIALIPRAKAVAEKLAGLPKVFSDALKGVKLATAVASQIQSWIAIAEPLLKQEKEEQDAPPEPEPIKPEAETRSLKDQIDSLKDAIDDSSCDSSSSST